MYVVVCICHGPHTENRGQVVGVCSVMWFWKLNSDHQAWQWGLLPTEQPQWPSLYLFVCVVYMLLCVCVVCVHVCCMPACVYTFLWWFMWKPEAYTEYLAQSVSTCLRQDLSLALKLSILPMLPSQLCSCLWPLSTELTDLAVTCYLGFELRSSGLHSEYFTHGAIVPVLE